MKKTWNIIGITVTWCAIAAYLLAAGNYSCRRQSEIAVHDVHIVVADSAALQAVTPAKISGWMTQAGLELKDKTVGEVSLAAIERVLRSHEEVREARVWINLDGVLTVEVTQRRPVMRVRSDNGYRFWVTDDNYIIPDKGEFTAYVPVVTGHTPFPFATNSKGSYDEMLAGIYDDYLGQFTDIENERRSLMGRKSDLRDEIRAERMKRSKRFWSKKRKSAFDSLKRVHIGELQDRVVQVDGSLQTLSGRKTALREKEKKSQQSHLFLTKLVNFVKSVEDNGFWASQIVQINVLGGGQGEGNVWKEPRIEFVPRVGDHIVMLGELDGGETARLEKLRLFYRNALSREGWETQRYINIRYDGQVICTK